MKNFFIIIQNLYPSLCKAECKIADYILANPEKIINMPIASVAQEAGVAASSIIRFCKRIGADGFSQLKVNIAGNLKGNQSIPFEDLNLDDDNYTITSKVLTNRIQDLQRTLGTLDKDQLDLAVDAIIKAEKVVFYGVGTSSPVATDAYFHFMRLGLPVHVAVDPHVSRISASMLNERCVAVGISHTGRTKDTIETLSIAKSKGAFVICITSFLESPIIQLSDARLVISSNETKLMQEAFSSRIAQIAILDSLYTCVALRTFDSASQNIKYASQILNDLREQEEPISRSGRGNVP